MNSQLFNYRLGQTIKLSLVLLILNILTFGIAKGQTTLTSGTATYNGAWSGGTWSAGAPAVGAAFNMNTGTIVNINADWTSGNIIINANNGAVNTDLNVASGTTLSSGTITINPPSGGNPINNTLNLVGTGSATCTGLSSAISGANGRDCKVAIGTGTLTVNGNIAMGNNTNRSDITFSGAGTLNVTGSLTTGTLVGNTGTINVGGAFTPAAFTVNTSTVNYNGAGAQTVLAVTYNNLTLSGSGVKTTTGVTVNGVLSMEGTASASVALTYAATATLQYRGSAAQTTGVEFPATFSGTGGVIIENTFGVTLSGAKVISNLLTMTSGFLDMANTNLTVGSLTGFGNLTHNSGTAGARTLTIGTDNTSPAAYSGIISNGTATSVAVTKNGTGTLILAGANTYTGATSIAAGTLKLGASTSALGTTAGITSITSGAVLDLNGYTLSTTEPLTLNGTGLTASPAGALTNTGVDASYSGPITLGSASTITSTTTGALTVSGAVGTGAFALTLNGAASSTGTMSGIISTPTSVIKNGAGTWILSGANTYAGATNITAGTLKLGASTSALGTIGGITTVTSGAVLDLNGCTLSTAEPLTLNGTGLTALPAGALTNTGSNASYGGPITLGSASTITATTSGTLTVSGAVGTGAFALTLDGAASSTGTMSGIISTPTSVIKNGAGTWILSGANSYAGATNVTTGTLKLGASTSALGTTAGITSITSGAVLDLNGYTLSTAEPLTLNGTGLTASPAGALTNTGVDASYSGPITLGSASTITATTTGALTVSGAVGTGAFALTLDGAASSTGTMSGIISTPSSIIKNGEGTWILSGANTYAGATNITAGTLKLGASTSALGTIGGITTVTSGAVLDLNGFTLSTAEPLTLNGTGLTALPAGALTNTGSNASYGGPITLGSASTVTATTSGTLTVSGAVGTGAFALTLDGAASSTGTMSGIISTPTSVIKNGAGTWILAGANSYAGATNIASGTLKLGASGGGVNTPLGTTGAGTTISSGAVLDLNGFTLGTLEALTINGTGLTALPAGALTNTGAGASYNGNITLGSASSVTATTSGTLTIAAVANGGFDLTLDGAGTGIASGVISNGSVTKSGAGTWTLSASNTYAGITTISAGKLKLGATGGGTNTPLGTTAAGTIVSAGAVLDLNGFTLGTAETLTLNGTGITSGGALTNSSASTVNYSGLLTLGSASSIVTNSGDINITNVGTITGSGFGITLEDSGNGSVNSIIGTNGGSLTKSGAGIWTISGANTYTGTTSVNTGTLKLGAAGVIADASALSVTGTLDMNSYSETVGSLTGSGTITSSTAGNPVLTVGGDGANTTFSGIVQNGGATSVALTKNGTGTLTLIGANTYSGATTINSGIISLGASNILSNSSQLILNGGTLNTGSSTGYSETLSTLFLTNSSTIALGTGVHTLTFSNSSGVSWTSGKILTVTGWVGTYTGGNSGTSGQIFVGNNASGLSAGQKDQIVFYDGTSYYRATQLATGEVVPNTLITFISVTSGNWNDPATWGNGGAPVAGMNYPDVVGDVTVSASDIVTVTAPGSAWSVNVAGTLNVNNFAFAVNSLQGGGTITINTGSITASGNITTNTITFTGAGTINVAGNFSPTALTPSTGTVNCNGAAAQSVFGTGYYNLTTNGGGTKTLSGNASVAGILTLNSGKLQIGTYNLTITNTSASAITGSYSNTSMIETNSTGSLIKQGAATGNFIMVYPVGANGLYSPMQLVGLTGTITNPGSVYVRTVASAPSGLSATNVLNRYWVTSSNNIATPVANIQFTYNSSDLPVSATASEIFPFYKPAADWVVPSGANTTGQNPFYATTAPTLTASWTAAKKAVFYTLVNGNWDDWETWTYDPSGSLPNNPDHLTPTTSLTATSDEVVILSGKTVTIQPTNNNKINAKLTVFGNLNVTTTTDHTFNNINGTGRIFLGNDNLPGGDASDFLSKGTIVLSGASHSMATTRTFYNVEVNMTNSTDIVDLAANYTINGSLSIIKGILQLNNNTSTTALSFIVKGTTTVYLGSSFTVGTGHATHTIEFQGDVTNNGTIDFANDAQYACETTGAVKAYFTGAADNSLVCNGITDLFRMFVNKGTDETFTLSVISTNTTNFRLFGPIDGGTCIDPADGAGGWQRLALVLVHGTLKLGSNITIPRLGGNRTGTAPNEFHIPSGTKFWVNGADVSTYDAGGGWRGITIYGTLQVSAGTFTNPNNTGGITYFANVGVPGKLFLEGGSIYTTQIKQADASGRFTYIQTGGSLYINNLSDSRNSSAVFALPTTDFVFIMSGGLIQIDAVNTTATNGIHIACDPANASITGGTFEIRTPTLDFAGQPSFYINSTVPLYNLTLTNSGRVGPQTVVLQSGLSVKNNLSIGSNTTLNANNYDVSVGGSMIVTGTYTPGTNTTSFTGSGSSSFTNNGTINPSLTNWTINKSGGILTLGGTGAFTCTNTLTLTAGTLADGGKTITLNKDMVNSGTHSGSGKILLTGGATAHVLSGSGSGQFGNLELDDVNNATITADQQVNGTLTMTNGIIDIGINKFTVSAISPNNISSYSATKMIRMSGNDSDDGLVRPVSATGAVYFPIGTNSGGTNRYTPSIITVLTVTNAGALQMNIGDHVLASLNSPSGANELTYYWRVRRNGLAGTATYQFTASDFDDCDAGATPTGFPNSSRSGFVLSESPYTRTVTGTEGPGSLTFTMNNGGSGYSILNAGYTVAKVNNFNGTPDVFYSNANYQNWDNGAIWHQTTKTGGTGTVPTSGSIVIIYSDATSVARIWANAIPNVPAEITFEQNLTPSTTENVPRLQFNTAGTFNLGSVKGVGMISFEANTAITVNGDFGDFGTNSGSYYLYYGGAGGGNTLTNIPSPIPSIMFEGNPKSINQAITVNTDFIIQGQTTVTPLQNITIKRDLVIGYWQGGTLSFPAATAAAITATIERNIDYTQVFDATGTRNITAVNAANTYEHKIILKGNILHGARNTDAFTLYNSAANTRVILELQGAGTHTYSRTSTSIPALYRLEMNKGTDQSSTFTFDRHFTLGGATNGATKALQLSNGTLILNNSLFNLALTSGGAAFNIPSTSALEMKAGTVTASGGSGITLDSKLTISGGTVDMSGAADENNYIEYSASGNANITISSGSLIVASQIRRSLLVSDGALNYNQTGGDVTVGRRSAPVNNRGMFEVLNFGSNFTFTGGTLAISNGQSSFPSLYLDPATSNIGSGAVINIGDANTLGSPNIGVYSAIPLQSLTVNSTGSPKAKLWIGPLTLNGNLNISTGTEFDANGLDLTINGNMTKTGTGTFTPSSNTTYFSGSSLQTITGNITFYNLTKTTSNNLSLASGAAQITVSNNLDIQAGTVTDNSNNIYVAGSCNMDGTHIYGGSGNGINLNGTSPQILTGDGTFGKLTINNSFGVSVPLNNTLAITNALRLQSGVLGIGKNLLTLNLGASIEPGTYSSTNMIQTNISFTDFGVKKIFPNSGLPYNFTYPLGSGGKYTPVTWNITNNGNSTGSITVKAANEIHPSIIEDSETPSIVDADNVLQYYWVLRSNGISGFEGTANMTYDPYDVKVTSPYSVTDYITARLLNDGSGTWNKYTDVSTFDESNRWAHFTYTAGTDDKSISGDYTAGIDAAIPNQIPLYETTTTGNWTTDDIWSPTISGGPRGSLTRINVGHTATVTSNYLSDYTTEINGTVLLNNTFGHRFGDVFGTGTLYLERDALPAGSYDVFFSSAGGTLEYGGTTDYDILAGVAVVNNLTLSGTGRRNFPNDNFILNGTLKVNGADVYAYAGKEINIKGNLTRTSGTFNANTGTSSVLFSSTVNQTINGDFTGTSSLNILKVNNPNGLTLAGNVTVNKQITLTNGAITTGANALILGLTGTITPSPGTLTSYINGALTKVLTPSSSFVFPVGKSANLGPIEITNVGGFTGTGNWNVEYFTGYDLTRDPATMDPALKYVSHFEYWSMQAVAGGTGTLNITLDGSSDIANAVDALSDIRIVGWNGTKWEIIGGVPTISGTRTAGVVTSGSAISFDAYRYITLASITTITTKTATITSGDAAICDGSSSNIIVYFTGASPWTFDYKINGVLQAPAITTSSNPYTINTGALSSTKTYLLNSLTGGSPIGDIDVVITVNPVPTVVLTSSDGDDSFCAGTSVTFTGTAGLSNYQFYNGVTSVQNGSVRTYTSNTIANTNSITVVGTNTYGCRTTSNAIVNNVGTMPTAPTGTGDSRCGAGSVSLTASGAGGSESYHWYSVYSGGSVQGTGTPWATPSISATTTFYLTKYNTTSLCESSPRVSVVGTVVAQPMAPGLTANPNIPSVCSGQTLTATIAAGTGGTGTVTDEYRNQTDGSTWSGWGIAVPSFSAVTGTNYIESRRSATGTGCVTSTSNQINWIVNAQPIAAVLDKNPAALTVIDGLDVSATLNAAGTGGTGCSDVYEYREDGGVWNSYTLGALINSAGHSTIDIRSTRGNCTIGAGCTASSNLYSWSVSLLPDAAGSITGVTPVCPGATGVAYSVGAILNATGYVWTLPSGASIASGSNTNSITIDFSGAATSGDVSVHGTNINGSGTESPLYAVVVNALPVATLTADNSGNICDSDHAILHLARSGAGALYTYNLTLPDATIVSLDQVAAPLNPHDYNTSNLPWLGPGTSTPYLYKLNVVNNTTGCSSLEVTITVNAYKIPETGPEYHIPNSFGL